MQYQTKEERIQLLKDLVAHKSVTDSKGENTFPNYVQSLLRHYEYFNQHPELLTLHTTGTKHALTALYKTEETNKTIVLMSHYDTVDILDYGEFIDHAFDVDALSAIFKENKAQFNEDVQRDVDSGDYLFGRGIMDMKSGLMIHMSILERAAHEAWPINLLLLTVPDEEVNSIGMRGVVPALRELIETHDLDVLTYLNGEPTFAQKSSDDNHYIYSGTIGKVMPSVYVYGKETHVGEPTKGVSSNYILSAINTKVEYNSNYTETFDSEVSPLPTNLMLKDLKAHYDVQTPFTSIGLYNVFLFNKTASELFTMFHNDVVEAVRNVESTLNKAFDRDVAIRVMSYSALIEEANKVLGQEVVERVVNKRYDGDLREQCMTIISELIQLHGALSPVVVTFVAPPYYPAVNSSNDPFVKYVIDFSKEHLERPIHPIHYFNGISDSSYVNFNYQTDDVYEANNPARSYHIPFSDMQQLKAPVLLLGALGKDAHQVTERVHANSVSVEIPELYRALIQDIMNK